MFKTVGKFAQDRSGNVAMLMAISLGAVSLVMFGGIQFNNVVTLRKGVQSAVDAAALTATLELGRGATEAEATVMALETFTANVASLPSGLDPEQVPAFTYTTDLQDVFVEADYSSELDIPLNGVFGLPTYTVNVQSSGFISVPRDEIALVLDVSVSMTGQKFESLKTATSNFVTIIDPYTPADGSYRVVNVLPFADRVNFGTGFEDFLAPETATHPDSFYEGCFEDEDTATQADDSDDVAGELLPFENGIHSGSNLPYCPTAASEAFLATGDSVEIMDRIDNLALAFGTGTSHALSWGWRTLSPEWRRHFNMPFNLPRAFSPRNRKIIILLTDGQIFNIRYQPDAAGAREFRFQPRDEALVDFMEVCEKIADQDEVIVYTIGFDLAAADEEFREALIDCATDDGQYFDADVADLTNVFVEIADEVNSARLTE